MYQDPFGRTIDYIRLSVVDRCDLRCFYCIPKGYKDFEVPEKWLTFDEIERLISAFASLGLQKVRITGGEPLLRPNLSELAGRLSAIEGLDDLSMSTNAVQLAKHADALKLAGIERLNISLDSLNPDTFREISGGKLQKVLDGIMAAKASGYNPIKINRPPMVGVPIFLTICSEGPSLLIGL